MKQGLGSAAFELLSRYPAVRRATQLIWPRAVILAYHRVGEYCFDPYGLFVSPAHFRSQMAYLRENYHVASLTTLVERLPESGWPDGTVVVTFDDGYVDNARIAYPIAAEYGVPLTLFVTVEPIRDGARFWWDELAWLVQREPLALAALEECLPTPPQIAGPMSALQPFGRVHRRLQNLPKDERLALLQRVKTGLGIEPAPDGDRPMTVGELRQFDALPGVTIGAHSMTHPILSELTLSEQRCELETSKQSLESILDHPVDLMAYPYGKTQDFSGECAGTARAAGFQAACTTLPMLVLPGLSPFLLPRMTIHDWNKDEFARRLAALFGAST